jgi:diketogulonate reductase-like aldo/keto reductase
VYCNQSSTFYDARQCRLNTWSALVDIFNAGGARSIGVSNYNVTHMNEILEAGLPLPSIIQSPFHLYRSSSQMDIMNWANKHGVTFLNIIELWCLTGRHSPTRSRHWRHPAKLIGDTVRV